MERECIIIGHENYTITDTGTVRRLKTGEIIAPFKHRKGYLMVTLYDGGKSKNCFVHRLVAQTFVANPEHKATVNHKNEIKTDNRACNLEWLTSKENTNYGTRNKRAGETLRKRWAEKKAINTQQATAEPI